MYYAPVFDMGWLPLLYIYGAAVLAYSFPVIVITEGLVFAFVLRTGFGRAVGLSLVVNLISGVIGVLWLLYGMGYLLNQAMQCEDCDCSYYFPCDAAGRSVLFSIGVYLLLTLIIEGFAVLLIKSSAPPVRCLLAVLVANVLSYAMITLYLYREPVVEFLGDLVQFSEARAVWEAQPCFEDRTCRKFKIRDYHKFNSNAYDFSFLSEWCFTHTYEEWVDGTWETRTGSGYYYEKYWQEWDYYPCFGNTRVSEAANCDWARAVPPARRTVLEVLLNKHVGFFRLVFG